MNSASGAVLDAEERRRIGKNLKRPRGKGGMEGKSFSMLIHAYWQSPQYAKLSPRAVKLLVDLLCQYRGTNNGDLTSAWSVMQARGWRSKGQLFKAQAELEGRGWIVKTRQGYRARGVNAATLWAVTFYGIDDCRDSQGRRKLEGVKPDPMPLHLWRLPGFDTPLARSCRGFGKQISSSQHGAPLPVSRTIERDFNARLSLVAGQK